MMVYIQWLIFFSYTLLLWLVIQIQFSLVRFWFLQFTLVLFNLVTMQARHPYLCFLGPPAFLYDSSHYRYISLYSPPEPLAKPTAPLHCLFFLFFKLLVRYFYFFITALELLPFTRYTIVRFPTLTVKSSYCLLVNNTFILQFLSCASLLGCRTLVLANAISQEPEVKTWSLQKFLWRSMIERHIQQQASWY